jgi:hypothetical protein
MSEFLEAISSPWDKVTVNTILGGIGILQARTRGSRNHLSHRGHGSRFFFYALGGTGRQASCEADQLKFSRMRKRKSDESPGVMVEK